MYNNEQLIIDISIKLNSNSTSSSNKALNYFIFQHLFLNLLDISPNKNNWRVVNQNISPTCIFENIFQDLNDISPNNNDWIETTPNDDTKIFQHNFISLNDTTSNNNDWIEIND